MDPINHLMDSLFGIAGQFLKSFLSKYVLETDNRLPFSIEYNLRGCQEKPGIIIREHHKMIYPLKLVQRLERERNVVDTSNCVQNFERYFAKAE
jgi:hypothetical protein